MCLHGDEVVLSRTALVSEYGDPSVPQLAQGDHVLSDAVVVEDPTRPRVDGRVDIDSNEYGLPTEAEVVHGKEIRIISPVAHPRRRMSFTSYILSFKGVTNPGFVTQGLCSSRIFPGQPKEEQGDVGKTSEAASL